MSISFPLHMAAQLASALTPATQVPPDAAQVEKFRAALAPTDGAAAPDAATNGAAVPAVAAEGNGSIGDTILRGLDHLRNRMNGGWNEAVSHINGTNGPVTMPEVLQFQASVMQTGFEYQVIGSIAGKATQGIDQLVKMQ